MDLLTAVLTVLHMTLINTESDISLNGFIEGRIRGASYDINQH
jgi:hypothetical protein